MADTFTVGTEFEVIGCVKCHAEFALKDRAVELLRQTHNSFWCPYCKRCMSYRHKSDIEKAQDDAETARKSLLREREMHRKTESRRRAEKAAKTRLKNRIAAGVCPCCNRHFVNVARHIKGQHPEFAPGG